MDLIVIFGTVPSHICNHYWRFLSGVLPDISTAVVAGSIGDMHGPEKRVRVNFSWGWQLIEVLQLDESAALCH